MPKIIIVGAGRLGKGFIGETFDKSGWDISFIDKDERVIKKLNENGSYHVTVHRHDRIEERTISNYKAYTYDSTNELTEDIINADVIALVIYPEDFNDAITKIANELAIRAKVNPNKNLDILCLTNKNNLMEGFTKVFFDNLKTKDNIDWFNKHVSFRDTIIRRSTDADDNTCLQVRTTAVLSLLIQTPLLVSLKDIEWMEECQNLALLKDLKVFLVNGPHVTAAFAGYLKGYKTINETAADRECLRLISKVRKEIYEGILKGYPISKEELDKLSTFPKAKGEMEDYIYRIAFDPIRKLSRNDRLTAIALVCLEHGIDPDGIAQSIANGFAYSDEKDCHAVEIQNYIKAEGIDNAIVKYCGIESSTPLFSKVKYHYSNIKRV